MKLRNSLKTTKGRYSIFFLEANKTVFSFQIKIYEIPCQMHAWQNIYTPRLNVYAKSPIIVFLLSITIDEQKIVKLSWNQKGYLPYFGLILIIIAESFIPTRPKLWAGL